MKQLALFLFLLLCLSANSSAQTVRDPAFAEKLHGLLDTRVPAVDVAHVDQRAIFLDAREPEEYGVSHIRNARPIGYKDFDLSMIKDLTKDTAIIVYCSVGYRSQKVTEKLVDAGFTNVHNLYGGIFEWVNSGQTVVDQMGTTKRVHAYNRSWSKWLQKGEAVY